MQAVALISGGKDSVLALHLAQILNHQIVAVAHLAPRHGADETDSYMYQSVGSNLACYIGSKLFAGVPFFKRQIQGTPEETKSNEYVGSNKHDEVEDLYELLKRVKDSLPEVEAVVTGAIFSNYQRRRVEAICGRLQLLSCAPLWHWPQNFLLGHLTSFWTQHEFDVRLVKVATLGLERNHLMQSLHEMEGTLIDLYRKYQVNSCGEGGEFESIVLNCPGYTYALELSNIELCGDPPNTFGGVWYVKAATPDDQGGLNSSDVTKSLSVHDFQQRIVQHPKMRKLAEYFGSLQFYVDDSGIDFEFWVSAFCDVRNVKLAEIDISPVAGSFSGAHPKSRINSGCIFGGELLTDKDVKRLLSDDTATWKLVGRNLNDSISLFSTYNTQTSETSQLWMKGKSAVMFLSDMGGFVTHLAPGTFPSHMSGLLTREEGWAMELMLCLRSLRNEVASYPSLKLYCLREVSGCLLVADSVSLNDEILLQFCWRFWQDNATWEFDNLTALRRWSLLLGLDKRPSQLSESERVRVDGLALQLGISEGSAEHFKLEEAASLVLKLRVKRCESPRAFRLRETMIKLERQ